MDLKQFVEICNKCDYKVKEKGLIKDDIPQKIIKEMEMIASEAQDWRVMFNAAVKQYKETWNDYRMLSKMKGRV